MAKRLSRPGIGPFLWTAALLGWVGIALADVWDPYDDSQSFTANELVHGSDQLHELGHSPDPIVRDVDYFRIGQRPLSSYEVVVDGVTYEILNTLQVQRWNLTSLIQDSVPISAANQSRSLRWQNTLNSSVTTSYVRVGSTSFCSFCSSAKAAYHIRSYDTTYSVPRFNNSATQVTVLIVQNTAEQPVNGSAHFWSPTGALLGSLPFALSAKQVLVQNTSSLAFASGTSGSITVAHDGRYGDLSGKAVALEPSTGFTFDTALEPRPR